MTDNKELIEELRNYQRAFEFQSDQTAVGGVMRPDMAERAAQYKRYADALEAAQARITELEAELHFERTGDCPGCRGTGIIDPALHQCGMCGGLGRIKPVAETERDALAATLDAIRKYAQTEDFYVHDKKADGTLVIGSRAVYAQSLEAILGSAPADHLNTVKAEAWDEGYQQAKVDYDFGDTTDNPYRAEQGAQSNG